MSPRRLFTLHWLGLSIFASIGVVNAAPTTKPNVLIILADDLGFSDLGCYGGEIRTPNLDALAKDGIRFTQAYNTARCWPSRAATMTGYYAQEVRRDTLPGVPGGGTQGVRPTWAVLLSEVMKPAGYRTYHSGKWHIDGDPLQLGFDRSYVINSPGQSNYFSALGNTEEGRPAADGPGYYVTAAVAEHAVRALRDHAAHHAAEPFFHYLCFTAPHFPLQAPAEDIARYHGVYDQGWNAVAAERYARQRQMKLVNNPLPAMEVDVGPPYSFPKDVAKLGPNEVTRPVPWSTLTPGQRAFQAAKMEIHAAMVDRMDREIGRVIDQLKAMGAYENTLIIFASDNGASAEMMVRGGGHNPAAPAGSAETFLSLGPGWSSASNTPFRRHKTWVHEGGISTPFIVHWPAGFAARGEFRHTPIHLIDLFPTTLDVAGIKKPTVVKGVAVPSSPGRSIVPAFRKDLTQLHDSLWWFHEGNRALRAGDWKVVALAKGDWELYDLRRDRGESHNLAQEQPRRLKSMVSRWTEQFDQIKALALAGPPPLSPASPGKK